MRRRRLIAGSAVLFAGCGAPSAEGEHTEQPRSRFRIDNINIQDSVDFGGPITFQVDISNFGDKTGTRLTNVTLGGVSVYGKEITLAPDEQKQIQQDVDSSVLGVGEHKMVVQVGEMEADISFSVVDPFDYQGFADTYESVLKEGFVDAQVTFEDDVFDVRYVMLVEDAQDVQEEIFTIVAAYFTMIQEKAEDKGFRPKGVEATAYTFPSRNVAGWWEIREEWVRKWMNDEITLEEIGPKVLSTLVVND